jgi:hypothetical protein
MADETTGRKHELRVGDPPLIGTQVPDPRCHCVECRHARFKPGPASKSRRKRRSVNHEDSRRVHHDRRQDCDVETRVRKADRVKVARRRVEKTSRKVQRRRSAVYGG